MGSVAGVEVVKERGGREGEGEGGDGVEGGMDAEVAHGV